MENKDVILRYSIKIIDDIHCSKTCQFFFIRRTYDGYCQLLNGKLEALKNDKNKYLRTLLCRRCEAADEN